MKRVALPETAAETLFGNRDENLRFLEDNLKVRIKNDGAQLVVDGNGNEEGEHVVAQLFDQLGSMIKDGYAASPGDVRVAVQLLIQDPAARLRDYLMKAAIRGAKKVVVPRSLNQRAYLEELETNDMVFGIGPAGTGKTYLAVAQAVSSLLAKSVARIVLARPAVEAGEKLGFLPGDLQDKVDPYLRPLYDALYDLLDYDRVARLLERNAIEVAPIAFMRGRTLNDAFVIIDEAQNTTSEQMKMVLTRIGFGSKVVITGDITQIDLPSGRTSGLVEAIAVLSGVKGISFVYFDEKDVVRHKLVQSVIKAYEAYGAAQAPR
ncbi:MAG TPA: PhoH family protein [Vicinamibacteria bacterium]|nr:PhoH family protein [Vicinamibacteria bacterium]